MMQANSNESTTARPKIAFWGTPEFAAVILEDLIKSGRYDVAAVVTQADKPVGRGQELTPSPVKVVAQKYGISVFTPEVIESPSSPPRANNNSPLQGTVLAVLVAYGKIIPAEVLKLPKFGFVNVHTSLLPRWRGAAPIHRALFEGDTTTGVSIMQMDEGLDTGAVYKTEEVAIEASDDFQTLHDKLLSVSSRVLQETIPLILAGKITPTPQSTEGVTYAKKWDKNDCNINWSDPAEVTLRRIRTCSPAPGARAVIKTCSPTPGAKATTTCSATPDAKGDINGQQIKIFAAHLVEDNTFKPLPPGEIVELNKNELIISTGDSHNGKFVSVDKLQFPGKNVTDIRSAINGRLFG